MNLKEEKKTKKTQKNKKQNPLETMRHLKQQQKKQHNTPGVNKEQHSLGEKNRIIYPFRKHLFWVLSKI